MKIVNSNTNINVALVFQKEQMCLISHIYKEILICKSVGSVYIKMIFE